MRIENDSFSCAERKTKMQRANTFNPDLNEKLKQIWESRLAQV